MGRVPLLGTEPVELLLVACWCDCASFHHQNRSSLWCPSAMIDTPRYKEPLLWAKLNGPIV